MTTITGVREGWVESTPDVALNRRTRVAIADEDIGQTTALPNPALH